MACDCLKKMQKFLTDKFNESVIVNSALMEDGTIRAVVDARYHKKNSKGDYQQKWTEVSLLTKYCPFCGKPYNDKDA